jgi:VWFA-related protein
MKQILLTFSLIATLTTLSAAQQSPQPEGVIRINVNLVQVDAVVTNSKGAPVTNLTADDFEVLQDGKSQQISNFAFINVKDRAATVAPRASAVQPKNHLPVPPPPPIAFRPDQIRRTIALVVDDLALSSDSTIRIRESLKKWVDNEMQPGDLVAIMRTSAGMGALQQFASDKRVLNAAIDLVRYHLGRVGISSFAALKGATPEGSIDTTVFDEEVQQAYTLGSIGAIQYVLQGLRELPGRKSLILFSENLRLNFLQGPGLVSTITAGLLTNEDRLRRLADAANRSSVVIHAVDPRGVAYTGLTAEDNTSGMTASQISDAASQRTQEMIASQDGMVALTQKTGGLFVQGNNDIAAALRQAVDDGDGYYLIGYQPDSATFDEPIAAGKFHSISVRVKPPGLRVRSRTGFFGSPDSRATPVAVTRQQQITNALASPFASGALEVRLTTLFSHTEKEGAYINTLLQFDAHDLVFTEQADGARQSTIDIAAVTFDADGRQVDGVDRTFTFNIPEKGYEQVLKTGIVYSTHLPVKRAGAYQMRLVLRDAASEKLGSATQFIEVPDVSKGRLTLSGIILTTDPVAPHPDGASDGTPALRIFKSGSGLIYAYQILNANTDREKKTRLQVQIRLFRDGRPVYEGPITRLNDDGQQDPKHLAGSGRMQLTQVPPGDYVFQIVVTDALAKEKYRMATQAIDFEVQ